MHSCIATLLFILATLSSALNLYPLEETSTLAPPTPPTFTQVPTCFARYSNYWDASKNYIYFNSPNETHFNLTITTKYMKFYPKTLAQWLKVNGFQVVNPSAIPDSELCGWRSAETVIIDGRVRGTIGYKYTRVYPNIGTTNTGNSSLQARVPGHHILIDTNTRPSDETMRRVEAILRDNSPDADVYYFMTLMLGTACGTLGFAIVFYGLVFYGELRRRAQNVNRDSEDIELDQIKVHNLSGSGMRRMSTDDGTDGPKFEIEIIRTDRPNSTGISATSNVADPPPIYSANGVGR